MTFGLKRENISPKDLLMIKANKIKAKDFIQSIDH